ncbi:MAG: hypothetical protein QOH64_1217 [Acidimicrobiaceae bacterium]
MTATVTPPDGETATTRSRLAWAGVVLFSVLTVAGWIYVFWFADTTPTDKLKTDAFPTAAQPLCAATRQQVRDEGLVDVKADTPQQRGELTARADADLRAMVARLRAVPVPDAGDAVLVERWLADWDGLIADRESWVVSLRAGDGGPLIERSHEGGEPASKTLDSFASANAMPACKAPDGY